MSLALCPCGRAPRWWPGPDGRGRYHCDHGDPQGDWSATALLPEPEAARQWGERFGARP